MLWALKHEVEADGFVILTDPETYAGAIHPSQALRRYRQESGIPLRRSGATGSRRASRPG
jgi:60 kDa SS-A/Ro ribonucleoprotein